MREIERAVRFDEACRRAVQRRAVSVLVVALAVVLLASRVLGQPQRSVLAQEPQNLAGVVVQFGDGTFVSRAVPFSGDSISGIDLLEGSGLHVVRSGGVACRIESDGCDFPSEPCFCQCSASAPGCSFWSYWQSRDGRWSFSPSGAADRQARHGEIDGWHWPGGPPTVQVAFSDLANSARVAPGVPAVTGAESSLTIDLPFEGDVDGDAQVIARLRTPADPWPVESHALDRTSGAFRAVVGGLTAGSYEVRVEVSDPSGVNGSDVWLRTATLGDAGYLAYLPMIQASSLGVPAPIPGEIASAGER